MKRFITLIACTLFAWSVMAQQQEYIQIITDKDCYLAGEDIWLKVSVTHSDHQPAGISKVAYIEVSNPQQIYAQAKIELKDGVGSGRIRLPRTMNSGTFLLTAYTRYQRNWGEKAFSRQYIAVANTLQSAEEDQLVWTDSIPTLVAAESSQIRTDKKVYENRSRVKLSWEDLPECPAGITVSVVRKDYTLHELSQPVAPQSLPQPDSYPWIAEMEGHIVTTQVTEGTPVLKTSRLACAGKDIRLFEGQAGEEGKFTFYTYGLNNMQDIALNAVPMESEQKARMAIVSPFVEDLPKEVPPVHLCSTGEDMQERSIGMQLTPYMLQPTENGAATEPWFNFEPDITYNLDEWARFTTVRETFVEFVVGVRVTKRNGQNILQILSEDENRYSSFKALALIDGIPIENHEQVLDFDARLLQYIHQYKGRFTFGGEIYDGIISMITHKGALSGLRLEESTTFLGYEFPQKDVRFPAPDYETEEKKLSRIPDFRHTLYWNAGIDVHNNEMTFYTSDMKGTYVVNMKGYTKNGEFWSQQTEFTVK